MPGRPITLRQDQYQVLSQAREAHKHNAGRDVGWGEFLLYLLGLYILNEATKKGGRKRRS